MRFFSHANVLPLLAVEGAGPHGFATSGLFTGARATEPAEPDAWRLLEDVYLVSPCLETDLHKIIYSRQRIGLSHAAFFLYVRMCVRAGERRAATGSSDT